MAATKYFLLQRKTYTNHGIWWGDGGGWSHTSITIIQLPRMRFGVCEVVVLDDVIYCCATGYVNSVFIRQYIRDEVIRIHHNMLHNRQLVLAKLRDYTDPLSSNGCVRGWLCFNKLWDYICIVSYKRYMANGELRLSFFVNNLFYLPFWSSCTYSSCTTTSFCHFVFKTYWVVYKPQTIVTIDVWSTFPVLA